MKTASLQEILSGVIAIVFFFAMFSLNNHLAKLYDKKHPTASRVKGHDRTKHRHYDMSKGEAIFTALQFTVVLFAAFFLFLVLRSKIK